MTGKIHSFQSLGTLDGPGVRFVVFLHGCNLRCGYCHNIDVCQGDFFELTPERIIEKILRYKDYFGANGGVTVSGGEPLMQPEFTAALLKLCKENGIHTVLDTSGSIWNESVQKVLSFCDMVLLDIKMTDDISYRTHIGCGIDAPLFFLKELERRQIPCWIRHVIIGGLNDTEENILRLKAIASDKTCVQRTELLPFRKLCAQKYESMGLEFPFASYSEPDIGVMKQLNQILNSGDEFADNKEG